MAMGSEGPTYVEGPFLGNYNGFTENKKFERVEGKTLVTSFSIQSIGIQVRYSQFDTSIWKFKGVGLLNSFSNSLDS